MMIDRGNDRKIGKMEQQKKGHQTGKRSGTLGK